MQNSLDMSKRVRAAPLQNVGNLRQKLLARKTGFEFRNCVRKMLPNYPNMFGPFCCMPKSSGQISHPELPANSQANCTDKLLQGGQGKELETLSWPAAKKNGGS